MFFFIWYFIEVAFFKLTFNESIDHCVTGKQSVTDIIKEYRRNNSISGRTMMVRILLYLINFGGFFLLCNPLIKFMGNAPLVAYFLVNDFYASGVCVAAIMTLSIWLFLISIAWLCYRPFLAIVLLILSISVGTSFLYMPPGERGMSFDAVKQVYS